MRRLAVLTLTLSVSLAVSAAPARATSLESRLRNASELVGIRSTSAFDALAGNIADTAARSVPVISSSAGFTYRYNPTTEVFERTSETLGPLFLERPDTLGQGKINVSVSFEYVQLDSFDGTDLTKLQNTDPIRLPAFDVNGNPTGFRATKLRYSLGLQQYVTSISATYGITDDLDVNLLVPIVSTRLRIGVYAQDVATADIGQPFTESFGPLRGAHDHDDAVGVGDILLRGKYQIARWDCGFRSAIGLQLRLPSGNSSNFQGTGDVEVSPFFYASTVLWERVEPEINLGVDYNASDVSRSAARYGVGVDVDATKWLNFNVAYLGRSQFERTADPKDTSFPHLHNGQTIVQEPLLGLDFGRKDTSDLSFGVRFVVWRNVMVFANGIYALNDSGLRNDTIVPAGGVEGTF